MRIRPLLLAAAGILLVACAGDVPRARHDDARAPVTSAPSSAARMPTAPPRTIWTTATTLVLGMPAALAASDGQVYVADVGAARILALDAATGMERWRTGPGRDVPGGLLAPLALAVMPAGLLAVLDPTARRIHLLGADGTPRRTLQLAEDVAPRRLCATPGGGFVVAGADPRGRLLLLDADGRRDATVGLPWADAVSLGDLRLQAVLSHSPDGTSCVAALKLGRGFAIVRPSVPPRLLAGEYVERMPLPPLLVSEQGAGQARVRHESIGDAPLAARDVAVSRTTIAIAFQGTSAARARLVDLHALVDGTYRGTIPLPFQAHAIATLGDTLFVLHRRRGSWAISALHAPALATSPGPALALGAR